MKKLANHFSMMRLSPRIRALQGPMITNHRLIINHRKYIVIIGMETNIENQYKTLHNVIQLNTHHWLLECLDTYAFNTNQAFLISAPLSFETPPRCYLKPLRHHSKPLVVLSLETPGVKIFKFRWFLGPSDQNQLYHTPLLSNVGRGWVTTSYVSLPLKYSLTLNTVPLKD